MFVRALIVLSVGLLTAPAMAQIGYADWTFSTIDDSPGTVTRVVQAFYSHEDLTGQSLETQHVAYSTKGAAGGDTLHYASRSNSNGGSWPSTWDVDPILSCDDPAIALDPNGVPLITCVHGEQSRLSLVRPTVNGLQHVVGIEEEGSAITNGAVALRLNASGGVAAVHVIYRQFGGNGVEIRHRWCSTYPECDGEWDSDTAPVGDPNPGRVGLAAIDSSRVQIAVPIGREVVMFMWDAIGDGYWGGGGYDFAGSLPGSAGDVAFKNTPQGRILAVDSLDALYVVSGAWSFQSPYKKVSGNHVVRDDHYDVTRDFDGTAVVVYHRQETSDLIIVRESASGIWSSETPASSGTTGRWPCVQQDIDGKFLIPFVDITNDRLRSAYGD